MPQNEISNKFFFIGLILNLLKRVLYFYIMSCIYLKKYFEIKKCSENLIFLSKPITFKYNLFYLLVIIYDYFLDHIKTENTIEQTILTKSIFY